MLTVAVTGGIGSGKSTASRVLADLGAVVVDSDRLAREVVAPGTEGLAAVTDEFGPGVLATDGTLDRAALARIVFSNADARHRLEAITHPLVRQAFRRARDAAGPEAIVVNDIPLVRTVADAAQFHFVVTVTSDEELRVRRLIGRGLTEQDARARMRAQISDEDRCAVSDVLVANDGGEEALRGAILSLWAERLLPFQHNLLAGRPAMPGGGPTIGLPGGPPSPLSSPAVRSQAVLVCARVSAAAGGLPCEGVEGIDDGREAGAPGADADGDDVVRLVLWVPNLDAADALVPALAAGGFPRAAGGDGTVGTFGRDGGDERSGTPERRHASADPGRAVDLRVRVRESPST